MRECYNYYNIKIILLSCKSSVEYTLEGKCQKGTLHTFHALSTIKYRHVKERTHRKNGDGRNQFP
jgi:hypothetical protein